VFSTIGDPKSSKKRYQNDVKMEFFSGAGQNMKIMLPPAWELTFQGSSLSKCIPFSDPFFMPTAGASRNSAFIVFGWKKRSQRVPKISKKPFENKVKNEPLQIYDCTPFRPPK